MINKCIVCDKEFEGRTGAKTCSNTCRQKLRRVTDKPDVTDNPKKSVTDNYFASKGWVIAEEKGLHGEDLVWCSEHQYHCEHYCKAMCTEKCTHQNG